MGGITAAWHLNNLLILTSPTNVSLTFKAFSSGRPRIIPKYSILHRAVITPSPTNKGRFIKTSNYTIHINSTIFSTQYFTSIPNLHQQSPTPSQMFSKPQLTLSLPQPSNSSSHVDHKKNHSLSIKQPRNPYSLANGASAKKN